MVEFTKLKSGDNLGGYTIQAIYRCTKEYIIFSDINTKSIITKFTAEKYKNLLQEISHELCKTRNILLAQKDNKLSEKYQLSVVNAINYALDGNVEKANEFLSNIVHEIKEEIMLHGQIYYLLSSSIFVLINILISLIFFNYKETITLYINPNLLDIFYCTTFGSIGALISMATNIKSINYSYLLSKKIYIINGIFRVLISMMSSIVVIYLIKSNIILTFIKSSDIKYSTFIFCVVAGFSERLLPNILKKVEGKVIEDNKKKSKHYSNIKEAKEI